QNSHCATLLPIDGFGHTSTNEYAAYWRISACGLSPYLLARMKTVHSSEIGIKHRELLSRHATPVTNVYSRISRRSQALQDSFCACARLLRAFLRVHWHLRNNCRQSARPLHPLYREPSRLLQPTTNSRISPLTTSFSASHGRRGQPISGVPRRAHVYPWAPLCAPPFTPAGSLS
ncbi:hypothetical protein K523DRAFT_395441, partial [Schizophyllum commune Tattone D]